jgi:hypothetical protein
MIVLLGLLMAKDLRSSIRPKARSFKKRRFRRVRRDSKLILTTCPVSEDCTPCGL